ncbi:MAG: precorrin-3B C(17)-methyltransferase [Firmicutes bacterium]|nr:precorrin-3B C(17)-methyltransferase [Bacillota bacterium]
MYKIYVVGIGPGGQEYMTPQAAEAIKASDAVVGYTVYVKLIEHLTEGKEVVSTAMRGEVERARIALDMALEGKTVSFVSSGDAGVYGMAGLMREVAEDHPEVEIVTVPGITAAMSGAAVLGAPLIHDFAVISLSDLLTPWELIEKRVEAAAEADFVICIYNPKSHKRREHLDRAVELIMKHRQADTPSGYVKNIGREGQESKILSLSELVGNDDIDMFTTVIVGNSQTRVINGELVTPRGYEYGGNAE